VIASFLRRPPPIVAALLNAVLGLLLVLAAFIALYMLVEGVLKVPVPPYRWIALPGAVQLLFVSFSGAAGGLIASIVLLWATPRHEGGILRGLALNTAMFAICMPVSLIGCQVYLHGRTGFGIAAVVAIFAVCGAVMAFALSRTARKLGVIPKLPPAWVALFGGVLAGLGVSAAIYFAVLDPLVILPMLWLGLVTYFCLKPLPQKPIDGL
jgi:hypothetical protein